MSVSAFYLLHVDAGPNPDPGEAGFKADINGGATFVLVDLGDFGENAETIVFQTFNRSDNLVDQDSINIGTSNQMFTVSVTAPNIAYVLFGSINSPTEHGSVYADNFTPVFPRQLRYYSP